MKVVIKTTNLKLTQGLKNFVEEKINSLEKFSRVLYNERYYSDFFRKGKPRVESWVEIGKETLHHKKGPFFWAECQMRFPRRSIRVSGRAEDLKTAITEIKDKLQRELKEYKEKMVAKRKKKNKVF
jgi:ribosomal subunit interface protein